MTPQEFNNPPKPPDPPHAPLIEGGSMPFENHIFTHETPRYRAWLDEVDRMDVQFLRTRLKLILDELWACGDGNAEQPRDIDLNAEWGEAASNIAQTLEDYAPPDTCRCTCGAQHFVDETGAEFDHCFECLDIASEV